MMIDFKYNIICSGIISGMILFQTSIIAPTVFKTLELNQIRDLLRNIFPKLFKAIASVSLISFLLSLYFGAPYMIQYLVSFLTMVLPLICLSIIPATNKAKDEGDNKLFSALHKVSVSITMIVLIINLFWILFI